jgi:hypothetical protein
MTQNQTLRQHAPRLDLVPVDVEWQQRDELFAWEQAVIFKHLSTPVTIRARAQGVLESALHD